MTRINRPDLRGWHHVLTGGVLANLSPHGFDAGMTGRWAYVIDTAGNCAAALARPPLVLDAVGASPKTVAVLPDRSSRILGAAATMLGLPTADFDPGNAAGHELVVAYDLSMTDLGVVAALRERVPGQVLFERATCWTGPPGATADISGLLCRAVVLPWAAKPRVLDDGAVGEGQADDRPDETIAAEIARTVPGQDEGDGPWRGVL